MSQVQQQLEVVYDVYQGTTKTFETIVEDPSTGEITPLTDEEIYSYAYAEIQRPDGTLLGTVAVTFSDRENAVIQWTIGSDITNVNNVGNWLAIIKMYNSLDVKINELRASFNILE